MQIKIGYEIKFYHPRYTPLILKLNVHSSRIPDLVAPDILEIYPSLTSEKFHDSFGNLVTRLVAPPGEVTLFNDTLVMDTGCPDPIDHSAIHHDVAELPPTKRMLNGLAYAATSHIWQ